MVNGEGKTFIAHFSVVFFCLEPWMSRGTVGPSVSSTIKGLCLHVALRNKIKIRPFGLKMSKALSSWPPPSWAHILPKPSRTSGFPPPLIPAKASPPRPALFFWEKKEVQRSGLVTSECCSPGILLHPLSPRLPTLRREEVKACLTRAGRREGSAGLWGRPGEGWAGGVPLMTARIAPIWAGFSSAREPWALLRPAGGPRRPSCFKCKNSAPVWHRCTSVEKVWVEVQPLGSCAC